VRREGTPGLSEKFTKTGEGGCDSTFVNPSHLPQRLTKDKLLFDKHDNMHMQGQGSHVSVHRSSLCEVKHR
jgi:hypothetical protein